MIIENDMKRFFSFIEAGLLICALFGIAVVLSLLMKGSTDLAAWVQAVGSIAALFTAIFVMARQNRNAARLMVRQNRHSAKLVADADRMAALRKAESVNAILKRYLSQLKAAMESVGEPISASNPIARRAQRLLASHDVIKEMLPTLKAIPVFEIGSFVLADSVLQFTEAVWEVNEGLAHICRPTNPQISPEMIAHFESLISIANSSLIEYDEGVLELRKSSNPPRR